MTSLSMVGHSDELAELACAWSRRDVTRSRTVVITGAAGVGKSRLIDAALDAFDPPPATVLAGSARLHSPAPYDWLAAVLDRSDRQAAGELPAPADALAWLAQDPDMPRERYAPDALLRIAVRVVRALVGAGPAVVVAEDLHALDPASLNLLAALAATPDIPALFLATSQLPAGDDPDRLVARTLAKLTGAPGAVRMHLRPWSRSEVADALGQVYPNHLVTGPVVDAAVRRSGGNPYLFTELLAQLGGRDPATLTRTTPSATHSNGTAPNGTAPNGTAPNGTGAVGAHPVRQPPAQLTAREHDVLECIAAGMANKQIARSLGIAVRTVTVHVSNLLRKTGTASRTDAAVWAVRHGIAAPAHHRPAAQANPKHFESAQVGPEHVEPKQVEPARVDSARVLAS